MDLISPRQILRKAHLIFVRTDCTKNAFEFARTDCTGKAFDFAAGGARPGRRSARWSASPVHTRVRSSIVKTTEQTLDPRP
eukprot:3426798-Rhodomonas_salina.2